MSALNISLLGIGDSVTRELSFVEQVSALIAFNTITGGVTTTRQLVQEFRLSTDGTFTGSFKLLTNAMLLAQALDPNNRLYIQVRFTRQGTDATGIIQVHRITFEAAFDANAVFGHGSFTTTGMYKEVGDLMISLLEKHVLDNEGHPAYVVQDFDFDFTPNVQKPIIYVASVNTSVTEYDSSCAFKYLCSVRVGIQKRTDRMFMHKQQIGVLQSAFNMNIGYQFEYKNVTFKTVLFPVL